MVFYTQRVLLCTLGMLALFVPETVDAQIVRRFEGGGVQVQAPFVDVNVNPLGGTSVRAPFVAIDQVGLRFRRRRRAATPPQPAPRRNAQAGQTAQPQQPTPATGQPELAPSQPELAPSQPEPAGGRPDLAAPLGATEQPAVVPFPTAEELEAMDDPTLFQAMNDLGYSLDVRLSRLTTGEGWQRYLQIPESVLRSPIANFVRLQQTLTRYDSVADNPEFAKIAGLPSFIATKAAMRQIVVRHAKPQVGQSAAPPRGPALSAADESTVVDEEVLPTPADPAVPKATRGERSILKRASRD